jgi:hypothetical protein
MRCRAIRVLVSVIALTAPLTVLVTAANPAPASALSIFTAEGTIYCQMGGPVTGVWVNAGSASGWANFTRIGNTWDAKYSRGLGLVPHFYDLEIGCGGSGSKWATTNYAGALLGYVANDDYTITCAKANGSCFGYSFDGDGE